MAAAGAFRAGAQEIKTTFANRHYFAQWRAIIARQILREVSSIFHNLARGIRCPQVRGQKRSEIS
ncbi:MAG: hypothetical protein DMG80_19330 [Acidobacteria bacterium]|nr:MAG: hypothetical protein DMG80_19330 [Acidobacteriota bacterium]